MSVSTSVQDYVAKQPKLVWRRKFVRGVIRGLGFGVLWRVEVAGMENIPDSGPSMLMMNHISLLDPILCMGAITNRFVIPMTKIENARSPILGPFVRMWGSYSVNRGEFDRTALLNSIELLKSGQLILVAPEGTRHPEGLSRPKDGMAYIATKADALIIPAAISGAVGWLDRMKRLQRPRIKVNFGRAFRFKTGGRSRIPREELSEMMEEAMYQLAMAVADETRRGVYSDLSKATMEHLEFLKP